MPNDRFGKPAADNQPANYLSKTTFKPGEPGWEEAKFRFRSSVMTMVTIVDHLYAIHLQISNLLVVAMREKMDPNHPMRRFLTPYTYRTIGVNDNARTNLTAPRTMANRSFALSPKGTGLVWAAAPSLLKGGVDVIELPPTTTESSSPGADAATEPLRRLKIGLNRRLYITLYKQKVRGIYTPYDEWNLKYWDVTYSFVTEYVKQYYGGDLQNLAQDKQVMAMIRQYLHQMEFTNSSSLGAAAADIFNSALPQLPVALADIFIDVITAYICLVTSGHEQVGSIAPYVQDASWCASKFVPGASCGTKNGALNIALLVLSTVSMQMRISTRISIRISIRIYA